MTTIHARAQITDPASLQGRSVYPQAQNARDGILEHCADDYYSISGSCCPSGYAPWTTLLGDETPCVSSLRSTITPPPVPTTSGTNTAATSKPTLVISDVVYAMQYPLKEESTPALSTGAIAGIAVGIAVTVLATAGLAIFFLKRRRSAHQAADLKRSLRSSFTGLKGAPSEARTSTIATQVSEVSIVQALQHIPRTSASLERGNAALNVFRDPPALPPPVHSKDEHVPGQRPVSHRKNDDDYGYDYDHDHDDLDDTTEGFHLYSEISSSPGCGGDFGGDATVLEAQEVQLARPQRLSRGYARIVYTHSHGSSLGSSASVPADLDLSAVEEGEQRRDDKDDHNNDDVNGTGNGSEGRNLVDK
ncbi:hypothetical protein B0T17DRAFT_615645 [Bombardia bombarda]|uniref:Uncharacterized protein n=1 Tax=Bombardia bombarda TaxID=252184 RepID=A0AA39XAL5_9PEZI|nr:hypothetical protein B0T17DRAFT_615645 [Bombardia bombarda]